VGDSPNVEGAVVAHSAHSAGPVPPCEGGRVLRSLFDVRPVAWGFGRSNLGPGTCDLGRRGTRR
jgi:hypothetical protein